MDRWRERVPRWGTGMSRRLLLLGGAGALALRPAHAAMAAATPTAAPWQGLSLVDHRSRRWGRASLGPRPLLLHFVYTGCGTTCPTQLVELSAVHDRLGEHVRAQVRFASVTVDPRSDTPARLAAYARQLGVERPGWSFVTGPLQDVERLGARLQSLPAPVSGREPPAPADHRTSLYLFDATGVLVQRFRGVPLDRARLADELGRLAAR